MNRSRAEKNVLALPVTPIGFTKKKGRCLSECLSRCYALASPSFLAAPWTSPSHPCRLLTPSGSESHLHFPRAGAEHERVC